MGDSIVRRARQPLDVLVRIYWKGKGGAGLCDLPDLHYMRSRYPDIIIIHIGTNDMVHTDLFQMRQRIAYFMQFCSSKLPPCHSGVVSYSATPFFTLRQMIKEAMEHMRRSINRWARSRCRLFGASFLLHDEFRSRNHALFVYDGVHLSVPCSNLLLSDFVSLHHTFSVKGFDSGVWITIIEWWGFFFLMGRAVHVWRF